jgi:hypothetical protein
VPLAEQAISIRGDAQSDCRIISQFEREIPLSDIETLRRSFRPRQVTTLFVGESPPNGGTFFYKENSLLYYRMKESFGAVADFLPWFRAQGFFLDDLVLYPINQIKDKNERDEHRQNGVPSLALRMTEYHPEAVVVVMRAIEEMVREAMDAAGLPNVPLYVTPFPGRPKQQERFKTIMAEIIPQLPVVKSSKGEDEGMLGRRIRLPAPVGAIYKAVAELEALYPGRKFTPDGHLVGSIGEVIAAEAFKLTLYPMSHAGHDASDSNGPVQVKMTAGTSVAMYDCCVRLIVLKVISPEEAEVIYDGPGEPAWINAGKVQKNGQRTISLSKLRQLATASQIPP